MSPPLSLSRAQSRRSAGPRQKLAAYEQRSVGTKFMRSTARKRYVNWLRAWQLFKKGIYEIFKFWTGLSSGLRTVIGVDLMAPFARFVGGFLL